MRNRFPLAAAALIVCVSACQSAAPFHSGALPSTPSAALDPNGQSKTGTVVLTISLLAGSPVPGGPYALSSATKAIGGTIGSSVVKPIAVGPTSPRCTEASEIITCKLLARAKSGARKINLYAYGTVDGSGPKLARALGQVTVYAGHENHVSYLDWNGFANSIAVVVAPSSLIQGQASTAKIAVYGVDPAGAMVSLPYVRGPNGKYISNLNISETGPYVESQNSGSQTPGLYFPVTFSYDGVLKGTENVRVAASTGGVKPATTKIKLLPGSTAFAQLFTQSGDGLGSMAGSVYQFTPTGSPNISPVRVLRLPTVVVAAASNGAFWGLEPAGSLGFDGYAALDEYDRYGRRIVRIPAAFTGATPDNLPFIGAAAVDAAGNAYVVDERQGTVPQIDVYAAGCYTCAPKTSIPIGTAVIRSGTRMTPYAAVDGSHNVYVVENDTIFEYAAGGGAAIQTISVSPVHALAADPTDNLYVLSGSTTYGEDAQLLRYPPHASPTVLLSPSSTTMYLNVATGSDGSVYVGYGYSPLANGEYSYEIEKLPAGSSTWSLLIGGPATEIQFGINGTLAVAP